MLVTTLLAAFHRWLEYRRTVRELARLDDRHLDDLGIERGRIREIARKAVA